MIKVEIMRKIILPAAALALIALIWACSSKTTTQTPISPVSGIDTSRPTVISTSPADGDSNVALDAVIGVVFSEEMDQATLANDGFYITGGFTGTIDFRGDTALFTPAEPLDSAAKYYAVVHLEVTDTAGNRMKDNYGWLFYTIGYSDTLTPPDTTYPPDTIPPSVIAVNPANHAWNVSAGTQITVIFSEKMWPGTITHSSFIVRDGFDSPITGSIECANDSAVFIPQMPLSEGQQFTVTLTTSIKDASGNRLASPYSWIFYTAPSVLLPLAIGNFWEYQVTAYDSVSVHGTSFDTILIVRDTVISGETWYADKGKNLYINRADGLWCKDWFSGSLYHFAVPPPVSVPYVQCTVPAGIFMCYHYSSVSGFPCYGTEHRYYAINIGLTTYTFNYDRSCLRMGFLNKTKVLTKFELH